MTWRVIHVIYMTAGFQYVVVCGQSRYNDAVSTTVC